MKILNRIILVSAIGFITLTSTHWVSLADNDPKQDFFENIVKNWGYRTVDTEDISTQKKISLVIEKILSSKEQNILDPESAFIKVFDNQSRLFIFSRENIIPNNMEYFELPMINQLSGKNIHYYYSNIDGIKVYYLSKDLFELKETKEYLDSYFTEINNSEKATSHLKRTSNIVNDDPILFVEDFINDNKTIFEMLFLSLGYAFLWLLLSKIIIYVKSQKTKNIQSISLSLIYGILISIETWCKKMQSFFLLFLIVLIPSVAYCVFIFIYIKQGSFDTEYIKLKFSELIDVQFIFDSYINRNVSILLLIGILILIAFFILVVILPNIIDLINRSIYRYKKIHLSKSILKYLPLGCSFYLIISIYFFDDVQLTPIFIAYIILSVLIFHKDTNNIKRLFTRNEKIIFSTAFLLILISGIAFIQYKKLHPQQIQFNLFETEKDVVVLPWIKIIDDKAPLFVQDFYFDPKFPIYINEYLVYYPGFSNIKNTNLDKYVSHSNTGPYVISKSFDNETLYKRILTSNELRETYSRNYWTSLIYLPLGTVGNNKYKLSIQYNCSENRILSTEIKASFMGLDSDGKIDTDIISLGYYPGCKLQPNNETISLFVDADKFVNQRLLSLSGINFSDIEMLEISPLTGEFLDFAFLDINGSQDNLSKYFQNDRYVKTDLTSFSIPRIQEFNISVKDYYAPEIGYNLAAIINEMFDKKLIDDTLIIWTTSPNAFIKESKSTEPAQ